MDLTEALLGEHGVLYALFDRMEVLVAEASDVGALRSGFELLGEALSSHARLEEDLLFSLLAQSGPIAVMHSEHELIDERIAELYAAKTLPRARAAFAALASVTRDHLAKEEAILFPVAQSTLRASGQLDDNLRQWGRLRGVAVA